MTPEPVLVVVTDFEHAAEAELMSRIERVCRTARPGSVAVQLRDHALSARRRWELARVLRALTRETSQALVVNDRVDLALALDADGVHLGEASVRPSEARAICGKLWISRASHDPGRVEPDGANAIVLAPIFEARHGRPALGVAALERARAKLAGRARLYALGGIDAENARRALDAGADGVAVMGAVREVDDPRPLIDVLGITA